MKIPDIPSEPIYDFGDILNRTVKVYANNYFLNSLSDTFFEISPLNVTFIERDYPLSTLDKLRS
jgi:hypothetical protein